MPVLDRCDTDPARTEREDLPAVPAVPRCRSGGAARWRGGLRAEGALSTMGTVRRVLGTLRSPGYGAEEASNPETLALQGSQGDRRCGAALVGAPSTTRWPRSGARPGWRCETLGRAWPSRMLESPASEPLPYRGSRVPVTRTDGTLQLIDLHAPDAVARTREPL
jgi:hypothetical protein